MHYFDIFGLRVNKYQLLSEVDLVGTNWVTIYPNSPFYFFLIQDEQFRFEYERAHKVTDIFPINSVCIVTSRDHFAIDYSKENLLRRILFFRQSPLNDAEISEKFELANTNGWNITTARKSVQLDDKWQSNFETILYRPFDNRYIFYHDSVVERSRRNVMSHMSEKNVALLITRQVTSLHFNNIFSSDNIAEYKSISHDRNSYLFPLYLYPTIGEIQFESGCRRANLNPAFIKEASKYLKLDFIDDGESDLKKTFGAEDIFNYAYALLHSPTYRTRYAEFLKIDFPRIQIPVTSELFFILGNIGKELVAFHLMKSLKLNALVTTCHGFSPRTEVEKVTYSNNTIWIDKGQTIGISGVATDVWNFHIGGYQTCEKWLKDRKGRILSAEDIIHYQKIIVALTETIRLMKDIDEVIDKHGGWPGAFI